MNHPRTLRRAPQPHLRPIHIDRRPRHLHLRIRSHNRPRKSLRVLLRRTHRRLQRRHRRNHLLRRKRHPNNPRRRRKHLIKDAPKALRRRCTSPHTGINPSLPGRTVRIAGIHQHRAHPPAVRRQMPPPHRHRSRHHLVARKHRRRPAALGHHRCRQIQLATYLDPRRHSTPLKTQWQRPT